MPFLPILLFLLLVPIGFNPSFMGAIPISTNVTFSLAQPSSASTTIPTFSSSYSSASSSSFTPLISSLSSADELPMPMAMAQVMPNLLMNEEEATECEGRWQLFPFGGICLVITDQLSFLNLGLGIGNFDVAQNGCLTHGGELFIVRQVDVRAKEWLTSWLNQHFRSVLGSIGIGLIDGNYWVNGDNNGNSSSRTTCPAMNIHNGTFEMDHLDCSDIHRFICQKPAFLKGQQQDGETTTTTTTTESSATLTTTAPSEIPTSTPTTSATNPLPCPAPAPPLYGCEEIEEISIHLEIEP